MAAKRDPCPALAHIAKGRAKDADNVVFAAFQQHNLAVNIPISYVSCGKTPGFPFIQPRALLTELASLGFLHKVLGVSTDEAERTFETFWSQLKRVQPRHEVFSQPGVRFSNLVPYYAHGDGGRGFKKNSILILSICSALGAGTRQDPVDLPSSRVMQQHGLKRKNPNQLPLGVNLRGHSFSNRWLFGAMPYHMYKNDEKAFKDLFEAWGKELEVLFYDGFQGEGKTWRICILGLTGDAPFLKQAGFHNRSFHNIRKKWTATAPLLGCCWLCGAGSDALPLEEVSLQPQWLSTCGPHNLLPWDSPGPLLKYCLTDSDNAARFYCPDLFHIFHAGTGKDFAASSLLYATKTLFQGRSLQSRLDQMNGALRSYLKRTKGVSLHCGELTLDLLGYESSASYPWGHWSKGADTVVLLRFLTELLRTQQAALEGDRMLQEILRGCQGILKFMKALFGSGFFLEGANLQHAVQGGEGFLYAYRNLVAWSHEKSLCLFALKPKLHLLNHLVYELHASHQKQIVAVSPLAESTFQCEDFVGRTSRLSRRVSPSLASLKVLYRYLTAARNELVQEEQTLARTAWLMAQEAPCG